MLVILRMQPGIRPRGGKVKATLESKDAAWPSGDRAIVKATPESKAAAWH
jgi:hypothetical protein